MKKLILSIACLIILLLFSSCNPQNENTNIQLSNNSTASVTNEVNSNNISAENTVFEKEKVKEDWKETVVINDCSVKNGPGKDYSDIGNLKYGDTIYLKGSYIGWYLAETNSIAEFWVDGKNIVDYHYNDEKRLFGVVTAEVVTLGQIQLNKGNLIWILKKDVDRAYARPVAIDITGGYSGWINNTDFTLEKQNIYYNQAFLKKDAKVYQSSNEESELHNDFIKHSGEYIFIDEVQDDGWVKISAYGGIGGWVKSTDIYIP